MKKKLIVICALFAVMALSLLAACNTTDYTVTFDSNGGNAVQSQIVSKGELVSKPADPLRVGYVFDGWYTSDGKAWNFDTDTVTSDITLYAQWTDENYTTYTVTFNSNGGSAVPSQPVREDDAVIQPTDPTKFAHIFAGWYTDVGLTSAYDFSAAVTGDITLYAKWTFDSANYTVITVDYGAHGGEQTFYYKINSDLSFAEYLHQDGDYVTVSFTDGTTDYLFGQTYKFDTATTLTAVFEQTDYMLSWDVANDGWSIDGLTESGATLTEIALPASAFGYDVVSIGDYAFANSAITSLTIPDSIVKVGNAILAGCAQLQTLSLPYVGETADTQYGPTSIMAWYFGDEYYLGSYYPEPQEGKIANPAAGTTVYYAPESGYGGSPSNGIKTAAYYPISLETLEIRGGYVGNFATQYMPIKHLVLGDVYPIISSYAFYHSFIETVTFVDNTITRIEQFAFTDTHLVNVTLPEGLNYIGRCAFGENHLLETAYMPNSVTTVDPEVFAACDKLYDVTLSQELTAIPSNGFINCKSLTSIELPSGITTIWDQAFEGSGITTIDLPDGVTEIDSRAFCYSALTSITLPAGLEYLGDYAFDHCTELASVTFLGNELEVIYQYTFANTESLTSITIPTSVVVIGAYAFYRSGLTSIHVPNNVTTLSSATFAYCESIETVTFGDNCQIERLPDSLFERCTLLTDITIPASVTTFGERVFYSCSSLRLLIIPSTVTTIEGPCFVGCTYILMLCEAAEKPAGWDANWNSSELSCTFIGGEIYIENDILYGIGDTSARVLGHFNGDSEVTIPATIKGVPVVEIGEAAFEYDYDMTSLVIEGATVIRYHAFKDCRYLLNVVLPEGLQVIEEEGFYGCWALESMSLPTTLESIGKAAFQACSKVIFYTKLTEDQRPDGWDTANALSGKTIVWEMLLSDIHDYGVFNYANMGDHIRILQVNDKNVGGVLIIPDYIEGLPVTELGAKAFYEVDTQAIYIPATVVVFGKNCFSSRKLNLAFEAASLPAGFTSACFADNTSQFENSVKRFNCTKPTLDEVTGLYYFTSNGKAIVVGVDRVHTSFVIPETLGGCTVDTIGMGAFYSDKSFVSMVIPSTVSYIGYEAFYNTNNALKVYCNAADTSEFDSKWNNGASGVFYYNVDVKYTDEFEYIVTDDGNVIITHYIGTGKTVVIPAMIDGKPVTEIGDRAFANDPTELIAPSTNLYAVTFEQGSNLTTIGYRAFYNCYNLCKVYVIPATVTSIGNQAFSVYTPANRNSAHTLWFGFENSASAGTFNTYVNGSYSADALDFYSEEVGQQFIAFLDSYDPWGVFAD